MDSNENLKIDILLKENQNIRTELTALIKSIQNCFFSFLTSLGIFVGILINLSPQKEIFKNIPDSNMGIVAILISQIELIIVVFSIYIQSDVFVKAAYISYIEKKINFLIDEEIIFWESRISKDMWSASILGKYKNKNAPMLSLKILSIFYLICFVLLALFAFFKLGSIYVLIFQSLEVGIIVYLMVALAKTHRQASSYINTIQPDKDMELRREDGQATK